MVANIKKYTRSKLFWIASSINAVDGGDVF